MAELSSLSIVFSHVIVGTGPEIDIGLVVGLGIDIAKGPVVDLETDIADTDTHAVGVEVRIVIGRTETSTNCRWNHKLVR